MTIFKGSSFFSNPQFPFYIDRYTLKKKEDIPQHTHDFMELVFVVHGTALHHMSSSSYHIKSGDVFVIEPQVYHSYSGAEHEEAVLFNVLFHPELLRKELEALKQMPSFIKFFYLSPFLRRNASFIAHSFLKEHQKLQMEQHFSLIHEEFSKKKAGYELIIKTRLIETLVRLSRFYQENTLTSSEVLSVEQWMQSICHYIEHNHQQTMTLKQMSDLCGMSISSFTTKFKQRTGQSFIDYKHVIQIKQACILLKETNEKILYIALEVGFNDISFFNKVFRQHMKVTPKEYRKLHARD